MRKILCAVSFMIIGLASLSAQDLIPRRIFLDVGAGIPTILADMLYAQLTQDNPLVAVSGEESYHNKIIISRDSKGLAFLLVDDGQQENRLRYDDSALDSYSELAETVEDVADSWAELLKLVEPKVTQEYLDVRRRIDAEVDLEINLAKDFQAVLWVPPQLILNFNSGSGDSLPPPSLTIPASIEFDWFFKENIGLSSSLSYEYSENNLVGAKVHRFTPGIGLIFRTLGRFSAEFLLDLRLQFAYLTTTGGWDIYPLLRLSPIIAWNISERFSVKAIVLGYDLDPSMFWGGHVDAVNHLILLRLGAAYRW